MKRLFTALLLTLLVFSLTACGEQAVSSTSGDFKLGDETYALEGWVLMPEYDSDLDTGVGLRFVQKEGVVPIVISNGSYSSLIDMTVELEDHTRAAYNISFDEAKDAPGYAGRVTFIFMLPHGEALPTSGLIFHTGTNQELAVDLSALSAPAGGN